MTQVYLIGTLSGGSTWADPGNWNPVNTVECMGAGGMGGGCAARGGSSGGGGGGGAYAVGYNLMPTFPVQYYCGRSQTPTYADTWATNFNVNSSLPSTAPGCVSADRGQTPGLSPTGTAGGAGGRLVFPSGFPGGDGGNGIAYSGTTPYDGGGGGGGAGGPHGAGSRGGDTVAHGFGTGGAADGGTVPAQLSAATSGNKSAQWGTAGVGGGSSSAQNANFGSGVIQGGDMGGGGGGANNSINASAYGAWNGAGLIIINYIPYVAPPAAQITMMA